MEPQLKRATSRDALFRTRHSAKILTESNLRTSGRGTETQEFGDAEGAWETILRECAEIEEQITAHLVSNGLDHSTASCAAAECGVSS